MDNKKKNSVIAVFGIILAVFVLVFFVVPFVRNAACVTMFVFGIISIGLGCAMTYRGLLGEGTRSKVYGIPLMRIGFYYMGAQIVLSLIFFIVNLSTHTPAWVAAVISMILLAAAIIGTVGMDNARDIIESVDSNIKGKIQQTKTFKLDISSLADKCEDAEAKKLLEKLSEKLKYSDPVSSPALADIEEKISQSIDEIKELVLSGKTEELAEKIKYTDMLVDDRNRQCKAEK